MIDISTLSLGDRVLCYTIVRIYLMKKSALCIIFSETTSYHDLKDSRGGKKNGTGNHFIG